MIVARIIIDARESGTSTGRYVDKLVEYLAKRQPRHEVVVLTKSPRLAYIRSIAPAFEAVASDYKEFTFAEQLGLKSQIEALQPDLVHFNAPQQPVLYRGRVVTTIHDLTTIRFDNPAKNWLVFKLKQLVYRWVVKRVAKKSVKLLAPSRFVRDDVAAYTSVVKSKIVVTYEAADQITAAAEPLEALKNQQFIMYVGRPLPHKNLERLLSAFGRLKQAHPELKLVLAGQRDFLYKQLERKLARHTLDGVIFTGFVSEGALRWLYEHTAAYVFPSLSEGFGLPGLEAMVHGAPVVSSNATCLPEIYGEAAHYFDPLDVGDMAAKIDEVLSDDQLRIRLIKAGAAQAKKYSWAKMAGQTLEVYEQALKMS